ncbi:MAG TPA: alpha-L-arabinofuranosidase [Candidatus Angelobacter sp.]|nr:alpha-L-arabinofuranosidase [Candidatus Angelobacter sp.]
MTVHTAPAQTNHFSIYSDQLENGFQNWSWGASNNFANTSPVHSGADSIQFASGTWDAISLWHSDFSPGAYTNFNFWVNGGATGGQRVQIYFQYDNLNVTGPSYLLPALPTNAWRQFFIPFSALGIAGVTNISRVNFQLTSGGTAGPFYLDDVSLSAIAPSTVHVQVDATKTIRAADSRWFGLNTAVWDNYFDTGATSNALNELGTSILRFPGGSLSDEYHWASDTSLSNTWTWGTSFKNFMHIATNAGVQAVITANYGTGTPEEATAWVRSANLTNHCHFQYWEVGNENYGTWETDSNTFPHDPYTYATRAAQYITQMKAADPTIKIGVPVVTGEDSSDNGYSAHPAYNPRTGLDHNGWTPVVLSTMKSLGVLPDFLVYHVYPEYQDDGDQALLQDSANWPGDAANLRQQITDYIGAAGTNIELLCTENNADSGNQGKQSTSIVNGLYLADSLANLMKTEFNGFIWWDLRNGIDTNGDFDPSLYGWRTNGDLGIIGNSNTRYPTFYTYKLMRYFARPGDTILDADSDYFLLTAYSSRKADGSLAVLVINKDSATTFNTQFSLANYLPWTNALVRSFGIAQDEATRTNSTIPGAQDIATNSLALNGTNFSASFPPYSVTLLTIPPAAPQLAFAQSGSQTMLQVQGQPKVRYVLQSSTDLNNWISVATNTTAGTTWSMTNNMTGPSMFWRTVWLPE